ncbi:hypothetical protein ACJVC5_17730 [Peredibacter sp. HCB2-198]|uniref:hypothetical protein n=1 Tax=Peredibacter sp. HCB2-198 TaxID=3383025 RepID=UPI0038B41CB9
MKFLSALAFVAFSFGAFAQDNYIKICNPQNKSEYYQLTIKGKEAVEKVKDSSSIKTQKFEVRKTLEATLEDLRNMETANRMNVRLIKGVAYDLGGQDFILIAKGTNNLKYLFHILGPYTQLVGDSSSCR